MITAVSVSTAAMIVIGVVSALALALAFKTVLDAYSTDSKYAGSVSSEYASMTSNQLVSVIAPMAIIFVMYTLTRILPA